jgi:hypothetical protein
VVASKQGCGWRYGCRWRPHPPHSSQCIHPPPVYLIVAGISNQDPRPTVLEPGSQQPSGISQGSLWLLSETGVFAKRGAESGWEHTLQAAHKARWLDTVQEVIPSHHTASIPRATLSSVPQPMPPTTPHHSRPPSPRTPHNISPHPTELYPNQLPLPPPTTSHGTTVPSVPHSSILGKYVHPFLGKCVYPSLACGHWPQHLPL